MEHPRPPDPLPSPMFYLLVGLAWFNCLCCPEVPVLRRRCIFVLYDHVSQFMKYLFYYSRFIRN